MFYTASKDKTVKIVTPCVGILLLFTAGMSAWEIMNANGDLATIILHSIDILFLSALFFGVRAYAPTSYTIDETHLIINRPASNKKFSLADITEVRLLEKTELKGTLRTFGVGAMFGYYGQFSIPKIGSTTFYATQMRNTILIRLNKGKKILISPDDTGMLEKLTVHTA
jgi:hypothetical protein